MKHPLIPRTSGIVLAEVMVAAALAVATLGTLAALNAQTVLYLRNERETNAVALALEQRLEQIRIMSWADITTALDAYTLLNDPAQRPLGFAMTSKVIEELRVDAYAVPGVVAPTSGVTTYTVRKTLYAGGPADQTGGAAVLDASVKAARLTATITWESGTRMRSRSSTVLLAEKGLRR